MNPRPPSAPLFDRLLKALRLAGRVSPVRWMLYDALAAAAALWSARWIVLREPDLPPLRALLIVGLAAVAVGNVLGLYERQALRGKIQLLLSILASTTLVVLVLALFVNLVFYEQVGRWILVWTAAALAPLLALPRFLGRYALYFRRIRVLMVGSPATVARYVHRLNQEEEFYVLVGSCSVPKRLEAAPQTGIQSLPETCRRLGVDLVVVSSEYVSHPDVLKACFEAVRDGSDVLDEMAFCERVFERVSIQRTPKGDFYRSRLGSRSETLAKRLTDVTTACAGLLLTAPLLPLVWIAVRLDSPGPAIFRQTRCGQFGRPFTIYKFRTMVLHEEDASAPWTSEGDARITRLGAFLRKTRLDEIPQFWNVLKGDMSIVGPRPERPELVEQIEKAVPFFTFRHWARPGITGLAQIRWRYAANMEDAREKLRHDLYYIRNWSLLLDVQIILRTISSVMKGAR